MLKLSIEQSWRMYLVICNETTVFFHFHRDVDNLTIPYKRFKFTNDTGHLIVCIILLQKGRP